MYIYLNPEPELTSTLIKSSSIISLWLNTLPQSKDRGDWSLLPLTCSVPLRSLNLLKLITCFMSMSVRHNVPYKCSHLHVNHDEAGRACGLCLIEGVARLSLSMSCSYVALHVYFKCAISIVLLLSQTYWTNVWYTYCITWLEQEKDQWTYKQCHSWRALPKKLNFGAVVVTCW